jgi:hypothetical protein
MPVGMDIIKKTKHAGKFAREKESSYTVGSNVN